LSTETERIGKVVGLLISVMQGEYSDTRDLAVAQMVLLGDKALPHLTAFLRREEKLEEEIVAYDIVYQRRMRSNYSLPDVVDEKVRSCELADEEISAICSQYELGSDQKETIIGIVNLARFEKVSKQKWGFDVKGFASQNSPRRPSGIENALRAARMLNTKERFPFLERRFNKNGHV
jgi:hypothetical protein